MPTKKEASDVLISAIGQGDWILALSVALDATLAAQDRALDLLFEAHARMPDFSSKGPTPRSYAGGASDRHLATPRPVVFSPSAPPILRDEFSPDEKRGHSSKKDTNQLSFSFDAAPKQNPAIPFANASLPPAPHETQFRDFSRLAASLIRSLGDKSARRDAYAFLVGGPKMRRARKNTITERSVRVAAWIAEDGGMIRAPAPEAQNLDWSAVSLPAVRSIISSFCSSGFLEPSLSFSLMGQLARQGHGRSAVELLAAQIEKTPDAIDFFTGRFGVASLFAQARRAEMNRLTVEGEWKLIFQECIFLRPNLAEHAFRGLIDAHAFPPFPDLDKMNTLVYREQAMSISDVEKLVAEAEALRLYHKDLWAESANFLSSLANRNSRDLDPRAKTLVARWAINTGIRADQAAWDMAAKNSPELLGLFIETQQPWPNPSETLRASAFSSGVNFDASSFSYLMGLRSWSARDRAQALATALGTPLQREEKISLLLSFQDYTPEQMHDVLCSAMKNGTTYSSQQKIPFFEPSCWIQRGAPVSGVKNDGEPLRVALANLNNWESAQKLADAGGWGSKAEAWLLSPRKKPHTKLKPWIEEAAALRDAKSLRKTISSVKKEQAAEDRKIARSKKNAETSTPNQSAIPQAPATEQPIKKAVRRL